MLNRNDIGEHADIIGADGVHVGTVDRIEGERIKLTRADSGGAGYGGGHESHHHYVPMSLVAGIEEDGRVRLSANGDVAVTFEEEEGGRDIAASAGDDEEGDEDGDEDEGDEDLDDEDLEDEEGYENFEDDDEEDDSLRSLAQDDEIAREFGEEHGELGDGNAIDAAEELSRRER